MVDGLRGPDGHAREIWLPFGSMTEFDYLKQKLGLPNSFTKAGQNWLPDLLARAAWATSSYAVLAWQQERGYGERSYLIFLT